MTALLKNFAKKLKLSDNTTLSIGAVADGEFLKRDGSSVTGGAVDLSGYLPLSGGTLTGPITGTSNVIEQRNSTSAQTFRIANTWTSTTDFEAGQFKWESNEFRIGSAVGSAGGTSRALAFGTWNSAGTFTTGLTVGTDTLVTVSSSHTLIATTIQMGSATGTIRGVSGLLTLSDHATNSTFDRLRFGGTTSSYPAIKRNGTALNFRLADDSADAAITAGAATFSGQLKAELTTEQLRLGYDVTNYVAHTTSSSGQYTIASNNGTLAFFDSKKEVYLYETLHFDSQSYNSPSNLAIRFGYGGAAGGIMGNNNLIGFVTSGVEKFRFESDKAKFVSNVAFGWANSPSSAATADTLLYRGGVGVVDARDSTNPHSFRLHKTYTSDSSREYLDLGYNSTAGYYDVASKVGSAGGSNQPIRLGHYATNGTTFTGLSVATSGAVTASGYFYAFGEGNSVSGSTTASFAIGFYNSVNGTNGAGALGYSNTCTGNAGLATGYRSKATLPGQRTQAAGAFSVAGDAQYVREVLSIKTTDATPTTMLISYGAARRAITSGTILYADILISGIKSDGSDCATYKRKVAIKNVGGTTSLVGSVETIGTDHEDSAGTDVTITADDTNDALDISVTGIAAETWRWVAVVEGLEIAYGT